MGSVGPLQLVLLVVVALLLFGGRGRISSIMGDMAKGVRSFRKGLNEEEEGTRSVGSDDEDSYVNVTPKKDKTNTPSS